MEHLFIKETSMSRDKKHTKNLLLITDRLITEIQRLKLDRIANDVLMKYLDYFEGEIIKIEMTARANPRYLWQELQDTFDYRYLNDKSITGADVDFTWRHAIPSNRIKLICNL